jgi:hypothetical protein
MVLISLHPRRWQKALFSLVASAGLAALSCVGQTMLFKVDSTPYDGQMTRVAQVVHRPSAMHSDRASFLLLDSWMTALRSMPYEYSPKWRTPREVLSTRMGDCKGKAVALYEKLRAHGAHNVRLIIGKHHVDDARTHAWVEWETAQGTLLLDPTFNWRATRTNDQDFSNYIPFYAYDGSRKYRAFNPIQLAPHYTLSTQVASGGH